MAETPLPLPAFTSWDTFPFEGDLKVKALDAPVDVEPARKGEEIADCKACQSGDDSYIWVNERWRVRSMDRPTGLPMILILEPRSHLDLGDLPNLLAAELGVMTVRVERAIRSLDDVARVHVNRWGDGAAHLHLWFMARPKGQLQLRGSFLPMWDDILPPAEERKWREDLALVAAWLAEFGGTAWAQPPRIEWQAPSSFVDGLGVLPIDVDPVEPEATAGPAGVGTAQPPTVESASPISGGLAPGGVNDRPEASAQNPANQNPANQNMAEQDGANQDAADQNGIVQITDRGVETAAVQTSSPGTQSQGEAARVSAPEAQAYSQATQPQTPEPGKSSGLAVGVASVPRPGQPTGQAGQAGPAAPTGQPTEPGQPAGPGHSTPTSGQPTG
ncbi:diadenosine tetraphosphate (Ap4A) HIT family hydrolase [Hamadaea flava]|nr:diadenosine tetraphosphate (Ap4A) HIT family hydrolase [Hamadaea flava]